MENSKLTLWGGRVLTAIPVFMLCFSASFKLRGGPELEAGMAQAGWPMSVMPPLGIIEIVAALLFAFPRTSVLGAILVTGYLGGATAVHVRMQDGYNFLTPVALGVMAWGGLYLRDARIRSLIPLTSN